MAKKAAPAKAAKKPAAKKAAPAKAAASKTATTVTLKHLAAELAPAHELSKKQAEGVLTGMIDLMVKNLKKGQRIRLVGLGILQVRKRAARMGRNPKTGESMKIAASKSVGFKASSTLKGSL